MGLSLCVLIPAGRILGPGQSAGVVDWLRSVRPVAPGRVGDG
ncbi:MAG TPA: hypothetical protein PL105_03630 [Caldilineaceae bacterium]|nr:hypothetical protein [Caldilineaceae bacterium]